MKIFIGSSEKHIHVAAEIAKTIESFKHEAYLWKDCFNPTDFTFERIMTICNSVDAGIFVLAPDDKIETDGDFEYVTRDNVLIEAGIFSGKLGKRRVALCKLPDTKIPSDFSGINFINYRDNSIHTVRGKIRDWIREIEESPILNDNSVMLSDWLPELPSFQGLIASAQKEIIMSSFFISVFQISKELNYAISNGVNVRFLLPDFWGENWMATVALLDGVDDDGSRAKNKMEGTLSLLAKQNDRGLIPESFKIRLIDCVLPTRTTIIDPDTPQAHMYVHISSYINKYGPNVTFHLTKQQHLFDVYKQKFEDAWNDARPIDFKQIKSTFDV